jgi:hypothetical protein
MKITMSTILQVAGICPENTGRWLNNSVQTPMSQSDAELKKTGKQSVTGDGKAWLS